MARSEWIVGHSDVGPNALTATWMARSTTRPAMLSDQSVVIAVTADPIPDDPSLPHDTESSIPKTDAD